MTKIAAFLMTCHADDHCHCDPNAACWSVQSSPQYGGSITQQHLYPLSPCQDISPPFLDFHSFKFSLSSDHPHPSLPLSIGRQPQTLVGIAQRDVIPGAQAAAAVCENSHWLWMLLHGRNCTNNFVEGQCPNLMILLMIRAKHDAYLVHQNWVKCNF